MPEGRAKVWGESELNALRLFLNLERKFGSGTTVPSSVARRSSGLARRSFYRYLSLLEEAGLVKWMRGNVQYKTARREEGKVTIQPLGRIDRQKAFKFGFKAQQALRDQKIQD